MAGKVREGREPGGPVVGEGEDSETVLCEADTCTEHADADIISPVFCDAI